MLEHLKRRLHFAWRYWRGNVPWDSGVVPPEITAWIAAHPSQAGRALDLGCGTGTTAIYLAQQGWNVVGVDFVPAAIAQARDKAEQAGVAARTDFHTADVTRLDGLIAPTPPFDLVIDVGCLHGIVPEGRAAYANNVTRLTRPGAAYLLYAFEPYTRDNGQRRGISADEIRELFEPAFTIADITRGVEVTQPRSSAWYTLQRNDAP